MITVEAPAHSTRFRRVSTLYPRMVCDAYDRDIKAAMTDDPATATARVAAYEQSQGWGPRDWPAVGLSEGHDDYDPGPLPGMEDV